MHCFDCSVEAVRLWKEQHLTSSPNKPAAPRETHRAPGARTRPAENSDQGLLM